MGKGRAKQPPREAPEVTEEKKAAAREPSEREYKAMEMTIAERLAEEPKVRIRLYQVPENSSDKQWPDEQVAINGYVFEIKRGEYVDVPQTVADVLEQAGRL